MEFGYDDIQEAGGAGEVVLKAFLNQYVHERYRKMEIKEYLIKFR